MSERYLEPWQYRVVKADPFARPHRNPVPESNTYPAIYSPTIETQIYIGTNAPSVTHLSEHTSNPLVIAQLEGIEGLTPKRHGNRIEYGDLLTALNDLNLTPNAYTDKNFKRSFKLPKRLRRVAGVALMGYVLGTTACSNSEVVEIPTSEPESEPTESSPDTSLDQEIQTEIVSRFYPELSELEVVESGLMELQDGSQVRWLNYSPDISFNPEAMTNTYNYFRNLGEQTNETGDYKTTFTHQVGDEDLGFVAFDYFSGGVIIIVPDEIPVPTRLNIPPDRIPGAFTEVYIEQGFFITHIRVPKEAPSLRGDGSQSELEELCKVEDPIDDDEIEKFAFLESLIAYVNRMAAVEACQGSLLVLPEKSLINRPDFPGLAYTGQEVLCNSSGTAAVLRINGLDHVDYEELRAGSCGIDAYGQQVNSFMNMDPSFFDSIPQEPIFRRK